MLAVCRAFHLALDIGNQQASALPVSCLNDDPSGSQVSQEVVNDFVGWCALSLMWSVGALSSLDLRSNNTIVVTLVEQDCHVRRGDPRQGDAETFSLQVFKGQFIGA